MRERVGKVSSDSDIEVAINAESVSRASSCCPALTAPTAPNRPPPAKLQGFCPRGCRGRGAATPRTPHTIQQTGQQQQQRPGASQRPSHACATHTRTRTHIMHAHSRTRAWARVLPPRPAPHLLGATSSLCCWPRSRATPASRCPNGG